jgi:ABC-2 type transport system permease protein
MPVFKTLIRLLAFFSKELHEIRRQPRLIVSLLLGPMLILIIFGIGYRDEHPPLRTILIAPENIKDSPYIEAIQSSMGEYFQLIDVNSDIGAAVNQLNQRQIDLIEILPPNMINRIENREPVAIDFMYNQINPQEERYYRYLASLQVEAINEMLLINSVGELQRDSAETKVAIDRVRRNLDILEAAPSGTDTRETRDSIASLILLIGAVSASAEGQSNDGSSTDDLAVLKEELETLDRDLEAGESEQNPQRLDAIRQRLDDAEADIDRIQGKNPYDVINPIQLEHTNLQGGVYNLTVFFAPSVVALILQHIAVTLGALSLVREHMRGTIEFFGVTPASHIEVLIGKYLAYLLYLFLIAAGLVALLVYILGVPFNGDVRIGLLFMVVFLLASIGAGFLISLLSKSDTQAVQLSMLILLFSVFFSGFILPAHNLTPAIRYMGYIAPMTQGLIGFQDIMLLGDEPSLVTWGVIVAIALITFGIVWGLWQRSFRRLN